VSPIVGLMAHLRGALRVFGGFPRARPNARSGAIPLVSGAHITPTLNRSLAPVTGGRRLLMDQVVFHRVTGSSLCHLGTASGRQQPLASLRAF
jgi:hypothetical protein